MSELILENDPELKLPEGWSLTTLENIALKIGFKKVDFLGYSSDQITPIQSDIVSSDEKQLTRNRGRFHLWK